MIVDNNSSSGLPIVSVLVKRGDELPKKNYETKLHPTYEVSNFTLKRMMITIIEAILYGSYRRLYYDDDIGGYPRFYDDDDDGR
jgi:hypothetical protein